MSCQFDDKTIDAVTLFHGHFCPGLAIGIRASESALKLFADSEFSQRVAVVETDMCGVDAIQFLTGCTFGKGNLIHQDYGKMAFSFFDRSQEKGMRVVLNPELRGELGEKMAVLTSKSLQNKLTPDENETMVKLRSQITDRYMGASLDEIFTSTPLPYTPPRGPKILQSLKCEVCGEATMESRTRRFNSKTMCIPCFAGYEQKIFA